MSGQVSQVSHVRQSGKILFRILWIIFVFAEFGSKIESSQWVTEFGSKVLSAQKVQACFQAAGPLALRSSLGMVPTANLFQLRSSFRSAAKDEARDFSCHWSLDSLPTRFSEIPDLLDVLMMERHTVSLHVRRGVLFQQFQIIAKARVWKDQAVTSFS